MADETDLTLSEPASDTAPAPVPMDRDQWFRDMDERCAEEGYFEPVGKKHWAWLHDDGPILLVTFETIDSILSRPDHLSYGHSVAATRGWSHLCVISDGETWFRDDFVWRYFDRLIDEGFFEDFDRVLFFGTDTGAHAACAYSVAAPGASVVAIRPRATLDPRQTGWDDRYTALRRMDFSSRYGYAPDMVEAAADVWLILDPMERQDAMHAALFRAPNVQVLRTPWLGDALEEALNSMGFLPRLLNEACLGSLTPALFARLWRRRMRNTTYLRALLDAAENQGHQARIWTICKIANTRSNSPRFRKRMAKMTPPATSVAGGLDDDQDA